MYVKLKPGCHFTPECWEGYMVNTVQASHVAYILCKREKKKESDPDAYFIVKPETRQIQATIRDIQKIILSDISMTQFPVNCNIATTCHKLQGKTLQKLVINSLNYGTKNWIYVVFSRLTKLNGLILNQMLDENKKYSCDPLLLRWEKRMKNTIERKTFEERGLLQQYLAEEAQYEKLDWNNNEDNLLSSFYLQRVAKYFDQNIYYGTITNSKPFKSENGILLWHVQYDDDDSEDFNKEEVMEAINLYKSRLIT